MLELNKVYLMDALELLKQIPDNSVDLILTDPPYNISQKNDIRDRSNHGNPVVRRKSPLVFDFGVWDNKPREEFLEFTKQWLIECCRVLKKDGTLISFFSKEDISYLGWVAKDYGVRTRTIYTWCKTNPIPSFRKVNYLSATEFIWFGSKGSWTFNFIKQIDMFNYYSSSNASSYGVTEHPTEKPLDLIKKFVSTHSNEGDLVIDPFMGSGTTALACRQLKRNFLGSDIDQKYVDMSNNRTDEYNRQKDIFDY